jgi:hypothetical protein
MKVRQVRTLEIQRGSVVTLGDGDGGAHRLDADEPTVERCVMVDAEQQLVARVACPSSASGMRCAVRNDLKQDRAGIALFGPKAPRTASSPQQQAEVLGEAQPAHQVVGQGRAHGPPPGPDMPG